MTYLQAQCPGPLPWRRRLWRTCVEGRASRRLCTRPVREIVNQLRGEVHEVVADPAGHNQAPQASRHAALPTRSGECSATPADSAPAVLDPEHPRWLGLPSDNGIPARLNASISASVTSSASGRKRASLLADQLRQPHEIGAHDRGGPSRWDDSQPGPAVGARRAGPARLEVLSGFPWPDRPGPGCSTPGWDLCPAGWRGSC